MQKRVVIVDISHLCYKAAYGAIPAMSASLMVGGVMQTVNTVIPTFVTKRIHTWSRGGYYPIVACFDSRGANKSRNAYFAQQYGVDMSGSVKSYKGGRKSEDDIFYSSVNLTANLLHSAGVCCLKSDKYEADDLIKAAVDRAKVQYPDCPIDIVTGDVDLVPLVDDQVSVFLASKKMTWAESEDIEKKKYVQLTPYNYQEYMESLTAFKNLHVPYNTVLLAKLLRGDKSDGVAGYPKFTPTKFRNLLYALEDDGYDISDMFRYDNPTMTVCYRDTGEPIPDDLIDTVPNENKMVKYGEPPKLTNMCEVLSDYLEDDVIEHIRFVYNGINLNGAFLDMPDMFKRRPAQLTIDIKGYEDVELRKVLCPLRINLPLNV